MDRKGNAPERLMVPDPLAQLIASCATFCVPECCGTGAFDVNAYTMLPWLKKSGDDAARLALEQLQKIITDASSNDGPFKDDKCICEEWASGKDCAAEFDEWRRELCRARTYFVDGVPTPAQRLAEAKAKGDTEYEWEIHRLVEEATDELYQRHRGNPNPARETLVMIAELRSHDKFVRMDIAKANWELNKYDDVY